MLLVATIMRYATPPPVPCPEGTAAFGDGTGGGAIGVDLGGTHLRVGLINEKGEILRKIKREVGPLREVGSLFEKMTLLVKEVAGNHLQNLAGIGLGLPGICNQKEGIVHQLPHYPSWKDVPAVQILKKSFSCPVILDNDANMAAIGEHWMGVAQGWPSFIMLTLGTGIGGGLFLDGKTWHGDKGFAGEVGHMVIERNGRPCACGGRGCWETYAASQAMPRGKTALDLSRAADEGDKGALKFWEEFGNYLGIGIGNLAKITGVEHYVINGGISKGAKHFLNGCQTAIQSHTYSRLAQAIQVVSSQIGEDGNLLGCAYSVFDA